MLSDLAGCQPARALLNEAPEYLETCFLRQGCQRAYGFCRFHISIVIEIMSEVKSSEPLGQLQRVEGCLVHGRGVGSLHHTAEQVPHEAVL